jgi:chemotaxis protein histidine kinase CheA
MLKAVRFDEDNHKHLIEYITNYTNEKGKTNISEGIRHLMELGYKSLNEESEENQNNIDQDNISMNQLKQQIKSEIMEQVNNNPVDPNNLKNEILSEVLTKVNNEQIDKISTVLDKLNNINIQTQQQTKTNNQPNNYSTNSNNQFSNQLTNSNNVNKQSPPTPPKKNNKTKNNTSKKKQKNKVTPNENSSALMANMLNNANR